MYSGVEHLHLILMGVQSKPKDRNRPRDSGLSSLMVRAISQTLISDWVHLFFGYHFLPGH